MSLPRPARALVAAGLATALAGAVLAPSTAAAPAPPKVVGKNLFSPLSVAVNDRGHVLYSENFAGKLWVKKPGKERKLVYTSPVGEEGPEEVGGISTRGKAIYFISGTRVMKRTAAKKVRVLADLATVEASRNPDGGVTYGAVGLTPECAAEWPAEGPPASYQGIVESHPYATLYAKNSVFVADAAANAIFRIKDGTVRTYAVLPPVAVTITPQIAESNGIPECAVGKKYRFEGVPTDVEVHKGRIYVAGLPGGPEDGSVPGGVFRINPKTRKARTIATGLRGASGMDIAANGSIYLSELYAGKITRITPSGNKRTFVKTPLPAAVEVRGKKLYATESVLVGLAPGEAPGGKVTKYVR